MDHRVVREDSPLKTLRFPFHAWLVPLAIGLAMLASGNADAATLENLEGQGLDSLYGTYVPRGDCKREPRVTVDDSGFAYAYRSEEHTSELQSLMRISYAVFCLKKKKNKRTNTTTHEHKLIT